MADDKKKEELKKEVREEIKKEDAGIPKEGVSMNSVVPITPVVENNSGNAPQQPPQLMQSQTGPQVMGERVTGQRWNPKTKSLEPTYENDHKRRKVDAMQQGKKQAEAFKKGVENNQKDQEKEVNALTKSK